ncbi:MAG: TRAP transporter small permease [Gammaproteobacteria bacterium]|nr:TRAP transporter small permease [Gammaproteobacteria bacterium]
MSGLKRFAAAWLAGCARVERVVTFAAFLVMIAVVFADVLSRELTGTGLHWARQAGVYANILVVTFGIGLASADGAHLRPRFADGWLPAAWTPALDRVAELLMAAFCLAFAVVAFGVVAETFELGERSTVLRTLVWPVQAVIPLVFLLAAIRHLLFGVYPEFRPAPPNLDSAVSASESGNVG